MQAPINYPGWQWLKAKSEKYTVKKCEATQNDIGAVITSVGAESAQDFLFYEISSVWKCVSYHL